MQKNIWVFCREVTVDDWTCQKCLVKICAWDFLTTWWLVKSVKADSNQMKRDIYYLSIMLHDRGDEQYTQNIQIKHREVLEMVLLC